MNSWRTILSFEEDFLGDYAWREEQRVRLTTDIGLLDMLDIDMEEAGRVFFIEQIDPEDDSWIDTGSGYHGSIHIIPVDNPDDSPWSIPFEHAEEFITPV